MTPTEIHDLKQIVLDTREQVSGLRSAIIGDSLNPNPIMKRLDWLEEQAEHNTKRIDRIFYTCMGISLAISTVMALAGLLITLLK